jgi:hypothetical protein
MEGWNDPIVPNFDLVVFLHTAKAVRLQRLRAREARHFGADAVAAGGWRLAAPGDQRLHRMGVALRRRRPRRSLEKHQAWLAKLPCPALRLDGALPLPELVQDVVAAITPAKSTPARGP